MCPSLHRNSTASLGVGRGGGGVREKAYIVYKLIIMQLFVRKRERRERYVCLRGLSLTNKNSNGLEKAVIPKNMTLLRPTKIFPQATKYFMIHKEL